MSRRLLEHVLAAVLTAVALALLGAAWTTYITTRDTQRELQEVRKEIGALRTELEDLWTQASSQIQDVAERKRKKP